MIYDKFTVFQILKSHFKSFFPKIIHKNMISKIWHLEDVWKLKLKFLEDL